jgi:hypothetical protein
MLASIIIDGMSFLGHIIMMYVGICFKKLDYEVVKRPIDEANDPSDSEASVDLEANQGEGSGEKLLNDEEVKKTEQEDTSSDQYRHIIGRTKEGIPIRVM